MYKNLKTLIREEHLEMHIPAELPNFMIEYTREDVKRTQLISAYMHSDIQDIVFELVTSDTVYLVGFESKKKSCLLIDSNGYNLEVLSKRHLIDLARSHNVDWYSTYKTYIENTNYKGLYAKSQFSKNYGVYEKQVAELYKQLNINELTQAEIAEMFWNFALAEAKRR